MIQNHQNADINTKTEEEEDNLQQLLKSAAEMWRQRGIDQYYIQMTIAYLTAMELAQAKRELIMEHERIIQNRSQYRKIQQLEELKSQVLASLPQLCQNQDKLEQACQGLDKLRKLNLKIFEAIFSIKQGLQKRKINSKSVEEIYCPYFLKMNEENHVLIKSYLRKYIEFTQQFDPFFLMPYEKMQSSSTKESLPPPILKLFTMNASYVYRLIKAKNDLQKFVDKQRHSYNMDKNRTQNKGKIINSKCFTEQVSQKVKQARSRRFKTINLHDESAQKFKERKQYFQSEPKPSTQKQSHQQKQQSSSIGKKFKIRHTFEKKKSLSLAPKPQIFDQSQDDDINAFRKKMLARRTRVRKIKLIDKKEKQQSIEPPRKNMSLNLSRLWDGENKMAESVNLKRKMLPQNDQQQMDNQMFQQCESEQQMMQPRHIQKEQENPIPIGRIKSQESSKLKQSLLRRKDRIKLVPLPKYEDNGIENFEKTSFYNNSGLQENNQQTGRSETKNMLFEIGELKKESSQSDNSNNRSSENFSSKQKQQQLFQSVNKEIEKTPKFLNKNMRLRCPKREPKNQNAQLGTKIPQSFTDQHIKKSQMQTNNKHQSTESEGQPSSRSYKYKNKSQSNYPPSIPHRIAQTSNILDEQKSEMKSSSKKQIRMKPDEIKLQDLFSFIEKQKVKDIYRKQFEVDQWKENIQLKHSYLTKFYMDKELAAFGISSPRYDGDYNILYWGTTQANNMPIFLFSKYLDYLQKFTSLNNIYIGNQHYLNAGFQKVGSNYIRKRLNFQKRELQYIPFLSIECANICFNQNEYQTSLFYSEQIQQFNPLSTKTNPLIGLCSQSLDTKFPQNSKFYQQKYSISQINEILENLEIDTFATDEKIKINDIKLFTLKDNTTIKSNYFYVYDGYFVPRGIQVYSSDNSKIMRLEMQRSEYFLFFGKNFKNIEAFLGNCSSKATGSDHFFAFKMFSKQLYGRLKNKEFAEHGCYGNWDISFLWQDQLRGTVTKEMPSSLYKFGPEKFYVGVFKGDMLLFGFEAKPSDFFF